VKGIAKFREGGKNIAGQQIKRDEGRATASSWEGSAGSPIVKNSLMGTGCARAAGGWFSFPGDPKGSHAQFHKGEKREVRHGRQIRH